MYVCVYIYIFIYDMEAYSDPRFNTAVDAQTGFTTRNIMCVICIYIYMSIERETYRHMYLCQRYKFILYRYVDTCTCIFSNVYMERAVCKCR